MTREEFLEYMDHFNNHRWEKVTSYFGKDFTLEYPDSFGSPGKPGNTLHSPQEFIENYKAIAANTREVLNLGAFSSFGKQFFVEFVTEFHVEKDCAMGKKGTVTVMNQSVLYDVDDKGKFKRIRIFHHRYLDPASLKNLKGYERR
jgi:hypothetical protein